MEVFDEDGAPYVLIRKFWRHFAFYSTYAREQIVSRGFGAIVADASLAGADLAWTPSCGLLTGEYPSRFFEWHFSASTVHIRAMVVRLVNNNISHPILTVRTGLYHESAQRRLFGSINPDQIDKERLCYRAHGSRSNPAIFRRFFVPAGSSVQSVVFQLTTADTGISSSSAGSATIEIQPLCIPADHLDSFVNLTTSLGTVLRNISTEGGVNMLPPGCVGYSNSIRGPVNTLSAQRLYRWFAPSAGSFVFRVFDVPLVGRLQDAVLQAWSEPENASDVGCKPLECSMARSQVDLDRQLVVNADYPGQSFLLQVRRLCAAACWAWGGR